MPSALTLARSQLVASSVNIFHAAHFEGRGSPRVKAAAEAVEEALMQLSLETDERADVAPDEEGCSLVQPA